MFSYVIISVVFALFYCIVAERFPKIKLWQGILFSIICNIGVHYIAFPLLNLTPQISELPWYEHVSEFVGHVFWFWSIELIRRDLRNRITHEPDPEVPLNQPYR